MQLIDLLHLGQPRVIGSWRVGEVLVDPGPSSCLPVLLDALGGQPPRAVALTHIHLDHAGATGSLLARFPHIEVWVHERGAPHLLDPTRLIMSATRLYGDDMQRLWGEVLPVPAERLRVLHGGERLDGFQVAYTPGHASHHVCYLHEESGHVFCGDTAGVRIADEGPVLAPTPPPDIDLELWRGSLGLIARWRPRALLSTHFGAYHDVERHLAELSDCLRRFERNAELGEQRFLAALEADLDGRVSAEIGRCYRQAMPPEQCFLGLRRYLSRRG
jgi:glyoxylase-like metal-dependent hydrolase (beta-lactamase superfamily II)